MTLPPRDYDALVAALVARQGSLSRRNAEVAQFFLNHPEEVAISTISSLATAAGVTPTAITRFAQELGYSGFPDLQRIFRERLLGPRPSFAEQIADLGQGPESIEDDDLAEPDRVFGVFVRAAMTSLVRIEASLDRDALRRAIDLLAGAGAIHVAAARGAYGIGAYAVYGLSLAGRRAHLIDNVGAMRREQVGAMAPGDALIVITFDDYTPETVQVAQMAKERGHSVIALTDNELSPVLPLASATLYVKEARLGHFRSQVPAMVLMQSIIVSLGRRAAVRESEGA